MPHSLKQDFNSSVPPGPAHTVPHFPVSAGVLLGLGLGGFFDGIVLHQILQWHHMLTSAGYPADTVRNLEINTFADGLFHASTYIFVVWGIVVLWRHARVPHFRWSTRLLVSTVVMGFGLFNLIEGLIDHQILGVHHVNETVPREQWIYWDMGFLLVGTLMLAGGWLAKNKAQSSNRAVRPHPKPAATGAAAR